MAHARSEEFANLVGSEFRLAEVDVTMTLRSADERPGDALSLLFDGPPDPVLPQAMYTFERPNADDELIFVTPIGADAEGVSYEAVFG